MDVIKTESTFSTMLPSDSFVKFSNDDGLNKNPLTLMNIKKEPFDYDDELYNLINPSTLANHQINNSINIKTEPAGTQSLQYNNTELFLESPSSKWTDVKDSFKLKITELTTSTIKHETVDIKIESHNACYLTPMESNLESSMISVKDESYGKLENFEDSSPKQCLAGSDNIFCDICGNNFSILGSLKRHIKEVHEKNNKYSCKICDKKFSRKENLKLHEQLVHLKVKNFKCTHCDKSFTTKNNLKVHENSVHLKIRDWKCSLCDKYFVVKAHLKIHEKAVHLKIRDQKCDLCDKYFSNKSHLNAHEKTVHLKIRTWKCDICNKYFSQSNHLKVHEKSVHLKIRDWKCNYCDKYFTTKSSLKVHENEVHLNIRNWKCNICEKSFASKSALKIHSIVHVSDYSEVCDICNKTVRYLRAHKRYMHSKTRAENLKCAHCDKVFLKKSNLKQHMIIHSDARN